MRAQIENLYRKLHDRLPRRVVIGGAAAVAVALVTVAACEMGRTPTSAPTPEAGPDRLLLEQVSFDELAGWHADNLDGALTAIVRSCDKLLQQPDSRAVGDPSVGGTVADWRAPCRDLYSAPADSPGLLRQRLEEWFTPFKASNNGDETGLFTGYYEAEIRAARRPDARYRYPIYAAPNDMVRVDPAEMGAGWPAGVTAARQDANGLVPYYDRTAIETGSLAGRGLELLWTDDLVDLYFLQVQGSGVVTYPDGSTGRIGFAAANGHPFTGAGKVLREEGLMESGDLTAQSVRQWLRDNGQEGVRVMRENARYIFFREIIGAGPIGAQSVALTPVRSMAVDPAFVPYGMPIWLDTTYARSGAPLQRLVMAQDTGSAIKGPVRGDLFWGSGEPALEFAGPMKQEGRYYLLIPKTVAERRAAGS